MDLLTRPGYYSLLQYCPDMTRMEVANLGVLVFAPGWDFIGLKVAESFTRVKRFFPSANLDEDRLRSMVASFQARVDGLRGELRTCDDLQRFIDTRANDLILTPARPMRVGNPQEELDELFEHVLGQPRRPRRTRRPAIPALDAVFRRPSLRDRVQLNVSVTVPVLRRPMSVPYSYENGVVNLVCPEALKGTPGTVMNRAEHLAVEGDLIQRHSDDAGNERKLVVVLSDPGEADKRELHDNVASLFREYNLRVVPMPDLDVFAREVEETAH